LYADPEEIQMNVSRRSLLKVALGMPAVASLLNFRAIAAPHTGQVKIAKIKTMGSTTLEMAASFGSRPMPGSSVTAKPGFLRPPLGRVDMMAPQLFGQDPLAIERHFYMMAGT
jgi:hypothetical protein